MLVPALACTVICCECISVCVCVLWEVGGGGGMRTDVNVHLYGVVNILVDSHMLGGGGGGVHGEGK